MNRRSGGHPDLTFTSFDNCIAKAGDRTEVSSCIARLSTDIQP